MRADARHGIALLLLPAAFACSSDEGTCRCGPPAGLSSTPSEPPAQDPGTVLGAPLDVRDGVVSSSMAGVTGRFSVSQSELGSSIALDAGEADEVCVSGELGLVPNNDFDTYWGARLSMSLNERVAESPSPWERSDVIGFAFDLAGEVPSELRIVVAPYGEDASSSYCVLMPPFPGSTHYAYFEQMKTDCWGAFGEPLPDEPLLGLEWSLPASSTIATDFDFCVSNLRPIRYPSE